MAEEKLKRQMGLLDATMINVGTVLASGIFLVPASIALQVPSSSLNLGVWVLGGVLALFGALTLAELSAAMPNTGGLYVYLEKAFSPIWGFLYGWSLFLVIQTGTIAALVVAFATYLGYFYPLSAAAIKLIAIAAVLALTWLNCRGVKLGVWTQNAFTLAKLAIVAAILVWALKPGVTHGANFHPLWPFDWSGNSFKLFGLAMIAALWAYDGWVDVTLVGGEIKNPEKNLPRSLVLSMLIIAAVYIALNVAYIAVLSVAGMGGRPLVATDFALRVIGPAGASFISFLVMFSCLGAANGFVLTGPRVYFAMASEGLFLRSVARIHPTYRTPHTSLIAQGIWTSVLVLSGTYEQLFTYVIFAGWVFYAMAAVAVIVLRRKRPEMPRPYLCWGYPVVPVLFVVAAVALIGNTYLSDLRSSLIGTVIVLSGVPAYWFWRRRASAA